ncbi:cupredoxin domain-containing protein [Polaribacter batillariae]|uniref:Cupredoxin domain-containing protein n=1 Tax=Polaribacter batillariae TaxID=2808900 RepID=A0ABX7SPW8_9FLAO|nr:cupredoxin domain-containing protein [Polaribacter batillariae]QTD36257.1 cupredoxin domain-containing protein [Polaribacter batillariae]
MKKIIAILVLVLGFAFTGNAQVVKNDAVKTVSLEQTKGEFTQKQITLSEGTYVFKVSNNNAASEVGLVLIEDGKDGKNPENHIKNAYVSQMVKHGKTESSKEVTLKKGTYKYFCPFNKTPQYTLVVE